MMSKGASGQGGGCVDQIFTHTGEKEREKKLWSAFVFYGFRQGVL